MKIPYYVKQSVVQVYVFVNVIHPENDPLAQTAALTFFSILLFSQAHMCSHSHTEESTKWALST